MLDEGWGWGWGWGGNDLKEQDTKLGVDRSFAGKGNGRNEFLFKST